MGCRSTFVTEFLKTGNATQSAKTAGYSSPNSYGTKLLAQGWVQDQLRKAANPVLKKRQVTVESLTAMAMGAHDREDARPGEQLKAVEVLAKLHKLLDTDVKHTHEHRFIGVQYEDIKTIDGKVVEDTDPA